MVTLIVTNFECYAKEVIEIFNCRHNSKKGYSYNRVKRVSGEERGMADPLKGNFSEACESWGLFISLNLHLLFHIFHGAFLDFLAGFLEGISHYLGLPSSQPKEKKKKGNNKQMGAKISPLLLIKSGLKNMAYVCRQSVLLFFQFQGFIKV